MIRSSRPRSATVLETWRSFSRRQSTRYLTQNHEPEGRAIRKHVVQPGTEKHARKCESAFRNFWKFRERRKMESFRLGNWSRAPLPDHRMPAGPAPRETLSATQKWLRAIGSEPNVIPRNIPRIEFPAGEMPPPPGRKPELPHESTRGFEDGLKLSHRPELKSKSGPTPKRTQEHRKRMEVVLELAMSPVAKYLSPEMMDSIKKSPYYVHEKDMVVFQCHQHQTQGANKRQCYVNLNTWVRNVAKEIVYRESVEADESDHLR